MRAQDTEEEGEQKQANLEVFRNMHIGFIV
jgi:hypothetical protein